ENVILGVGANTFLNVSHRYMTPDLYNVYIDRVHNQYLLVWAEMGLIGLLTYLGMMGSFWKEAWQAAVGGATPFTRSVGIGTSLGLLAMMIHMMVDMYSSEMIISSIFMLVGLCTVARQVQTKTAVSGKRPPPITTTSQLLFRKYEGENTPSPL